MRSPFVDLAVWKSHDARRTWWSPQRGVPRQGVTAIDVPGGHGSLLQEPNVAAVADVLAPLLAEADRALAEQRSAAAG
jgi:thioesterase domain-containing protein